MSWQETISTQPRSYLLQSLPQDVLCSIIEFVELADATDNLSPTCKAVHTLFADNYLWEVLFKRDAGMVEQAVFFSIAHRCFAINCPEAIIEKYLAELRSRREEESGDKQKARAVVASLTAGMAGSGSTTTSSDAVTDTGPIELPAPTFSLDPEDCEALSDVCWRDVYYASQKDSVRCIDELESLTQMVKKLTHRTCHTSELYFQFHFSLAQLRGISKDLATLQLGTKQKKYFEASATQRQGHSRFQLSSRIVKNYIATHLSFVGTAMWSLSETYHCAALFGTGLIMGGVELGFITTFMNAINSFQDRGSAGPSRISKFFQEFSQVMATNRLFRNSFELSSVPRIAIRYYSVFTLMLWVSKAVLHQRWSSAPSSSSSACSPVYIQTQVAQRLGARHSLFHSILAVADTLVATTLQYMLARYWKFFSWPLDEAVPTLCLWAGWAKLATTIFRMVRNIKYQKWSQTTNTTWFWRVFKFYYLSQMINPLTRSCAKLYFHLIGGADVKRALSSSSSGDEVAIVGQLFAVFFSSFLRYHLSALLVSPYTTLGGGIFGGGAGSTTVGGSGTLGATAASATATAAPVAALPAASKAAGGGGGGVTASIHNFLTQNLLNGNGSTICIMDTAEELVLSTLAACVGFREASMSASYVWRASRAIGFEGVRYVVMMMVGDATVK